MYKKFNNYTEAITVLLTYIQDVNRAYKFAVEVGNKECWSLFGAGQLENGMVDKAFDSYNKSEDLSS